MNSQPIIAQPGQASLLEVVLPEQANHYGTLYGANALQMMGKAAFVCATRQARCPVVMARADEIEFFRPIPLGSIIEIRAHIAHQGRSSMEVNVEIVPEQPAGQDATPAIIGRFRMVAVDKEGRPVSIPVSDQHAKEEIRP